MLAFVSLNIRRFWMRSFVVLEPLCLFYALGYPAFACFATSSLHGNEVGFCQVSSRGKWTQNSGRLHIAVWHYKLCRHNFSGIPKLLWPTPKNCAESAHFSNITAIQVRITMSRYSFLGPHNFHYIGYFSAFPRRSRLHFLGLHPGFNVILPVVLQWFLFLLSLPSQSVLVYLYPRWAWNVVHFLLSLQVLCEEWLVVSGYDQLVLDRKSVV